MPETSFPFAGGQGMTDAAYERLMSKVTGNGRIDLDAPGNSLTAPIVYADSTGRQFKVRANAAYLLRGFRWESGAEGIVRSLDANTSGNPRLDLVALRLDRSNFTIRLVVIKGTPAAVPSLPTLTQSVDTGSTSSRYEIPLASIRIASNNSAGQPSIGSGDVTSYEAWNAAPPQIGHSLAMPAPRPGGIYAQYDTGKVYAGTQSKWQLIGEDGAEVKVNSTESIWDPNNFEFYYRRRNGWVWFQGYTFRKAGLADAAAGSDLIVCTLPSAALPAFGIVYGSGTMTGNTPIRWQLEASGRVTIVEHAVLKAGQQVALDPMTWPAKNT